MIRRSVSPLRQTNKSRCSPMNAMKGRHDENVCTGRLPIDGFWRQRPVSHACMQPLSFVLLIRNTPLQVPINSTSTSTPTTPTTATTVTTTPNSYVSEIRPSIFPGCSSLDCYCPHVKYKRSGGGWLSYFWYPEHSSILHL